MSRAPAAPSMTDKAVLTRYNQQLAQLFTNSTAWTLGGVRWFLQRFYYCYADSSGPHVRMHQHDWFELSLVAQGSIEYSTQRKACLLKQGDVFFMSPGEPHSWTMRDEPLVLFSLQLKPTVNSPAGPKLLDQLALDSRRDLFHLKHPTRLVRTHNDIWQQLHTRSSSPVLADILHAYLQLFLVAFIEEAAAPSLEPVPVVFPEQEANGAAKTRHILDFIRQNIHQPIQIEDIASHFHYSVRHIGRLFRDEHGVTIGQYIQEQKLLAAQRLLVSTNDPIKAVALSLGYQDVSYFCRMFSKHFSVAPGKYRQQIVTNS